jgi:hypothetical protein
MKVFLIEKAPYPLFEVTLTLYWTSSVPVRAECVKVKVLIFVVPTIAQKVSSYVDFL